MVAANGSFRASASGSASSCYANSQVSPNNALPCIATLSRTEICYYLDRYVTIVFTVILPVVMTVTNVISVCDAYVQGI